MLYFDKTGLLNYSLQVTTGHYSDFLQVFEIGELPGKGGSCFYLS